MRTALSLFLLSAVVLSAEAADPNPAEAKLRESLRNTTLQLRSAQAERDTLQAEKTQLDQEKQKLAGELEAATKQAAIDQETASKKIASLEEGSSSKDAEIARLTQSLEKWKAAHAQVTTVAAQKEEERARLSQHSIELQRRVDDQQAKNLAMYKIATEILARYESFGLGTALAAREPFVGTTRTRLENLVQDYKDKLLQQRNRPEPSAPARQPEKTTPAGAPRSGTETAKAEVKKG